MRVLDAIIKRAVDLAVSVLGILLLSPLLLVIAVLVKLDSAGPVFYVSRRMGRNGTLFKMVKFRSMYVNSPPLYNPDGSMRVAQVDPRVTRVGRILRMGFDELPQLYNVFRGDMSLIGPRPDPPEALPHYRDSDHKRLLVRPGMTGLAQIVGRTDIPWEKRLDYDQAYLEHYSLWLDIQIVFYTFFEFVPFLRNHESHRLARIISAPLDKGL